MTTALCAPASPAPTCESRAEPCLTSPIRLRGHRLRSRLVLPPMASGTGDEEGFVTEETIEHYARIVGPGHALAFVEYTHVVAEGRSEPRQLGIDTDAHVPGMARLARVIRASGALAGLQLTHAGGKTEAALIGATPVGASAVAIPAYGGELPAPAPMDAFQVQRVIDCFVAAARRAVAAGFDAVEVHAAHGYLLNQWLSPLTNRRADEHGDGLAGRAALLLEIVRRLREVLPARMLISVRFPAQDRLEGGLTPDDGVRLARSLHLVGVDVFNVSSGLGGWRRGREQRGEGYLVGDAAKLRAAAGVPVIGVGGIESSRYADAVLARGDVDMVAVGRAVLENPAWPVSSGAPG